MSTLNRLKAQGKVYFDVDFRKNSLIEDISQASPTTTTTSTFTNYLQGRAYYAPITDSRIAYASNTTLDNLTEGVILFFGDIQSQVTNEWLLSKRDAGGTSFELYFNSATGISFSYGGGVVSVTASYEGSKMAGVRFKHGEVADFYKNGAYETSSGTTISITPNDAPVYVGSFFGNFDRNFKQPIFLTLILDHSVTDDEIAALYEEFIQSRGALLTEIRNPVFDKTTMFGSDEATIRYDFETFESTGGFTDLSGNSDIGVVTRYLFGKDKNINGKQFKLVSDRVDSTNNTVLSNATKFSRRIVGNIDDWSANGTFYNIGSNTFTIFYLPGGTLRVFCGGGGNYVNYTIGTTTEVLDLIVDYDGSEAVENDRVKVYLNGELLTGGVYVGTFPASIPSTTSKEQIGSLNSSFPLSGNAFLFEAYPETQGSNASMWFSKWNKNLILKHFAENTPPTTVTIPASSPIPFTAWDVKSGSFDIIESNNSKYLSAITKTSGASMIGEGHFGTHIFEMNKVTDETNALFFFGMKNTNLYTTTGQTGYVIQFDSTENFTLKRCDALALTQIGIASEKISLDTFYKIAVTRTAGGLMKVYAKGGVYTDWTEVISATDTNHTQGNCYQVYQTNVIASYYRFIDYYSMPLTIDQLNSIY